jgi:signal transduction histidine kinase
MDTINIKEKRLIEVNRLSKLNDIITMLSHQLNQPLNNISLLSNQLKNADDESYKSNILNDINDQIKFLSETLREFRGLFDIEKDKKRFNVGNSLDFINTLLMTKRQQFRFKVIMDCPEEVYIYGDENSFIHAIFNLCCNSADEIIKQRADNGHIWVNIKEDDEQVQIIVQDNAGGLQQDVSPEVIFRPYFTTKGKNGTGVGLYVTRFIIEKVLKGAITAENCDHGMLFNITLPKA